MTTSKIIAACLILLLGMCLSVVFGILVMVNGWGLQVKSYGWVIFVSISAQIAAQLCFRLSENLLKDK